MPSPTDPRLVPVPEDALTVQDRAKRAAGRRAADFVEDGMRVGLGTGSTAAWFVRALAARVVDEGLRIETVATSEATAELARGLGITVGALDGRLDLTVDGADEVDGNLDLVKGGGGALLREKIVAASSARMIVIADAGKRVGTLGAFPLAVEVVRFGWPATQEAIGAALARSDVAKRRIGRRTKGNDPVVTDEGHYLLDLHLGRIGDPGALAAALAAIPGVVEHGLFLGMAESLVIGDENGSVEVLGRAGSAPRAFARDPLDDALGAPGEAMRDQDA